MRQGFPILGRPPGPWEQAGYWRSNPITLNSPQTLWKLVHVGKQSYVVFFPPLFVLLVFSIRKFPYLTEVEREDRFFFLSYPFNHTLIYLRTPWGVQTPQMESADTMPFRPFYGSTLVTMYFNHCFWTILLFLCGAQSQFILPQGVPLVSFQQVVNFASLVPKGPSSPLLTPFASDSNRRAGHCCGHLKPHLQWPLHQSSALGLPGLMLAGII